MASAPSARSGEKASATEVPSWVHKLKEGLQRTAQPEGEPSAPEVLSSPTAPAPAPAPARAPEPPAAPAVAAPVATAPAEPGRHPEPAPRHEPRARKSNGPSLTPAPRRAQLAPAAPAMGISDQAAAASPSTIVRLQLPDRRLVLALLPAVPRVGEIVDLSGEGGPQPFDVLAVRWGVHASGGFTGVTVELRSRG